MRSAEIGPPGDIRPHDTSRELGSSSLQIPARQVPAAPPRARNEYPESRTTQLAEPEAPTTTEPLHRARRDPALAWNSRYPVRPSVGDWLPLQGRPRQVAPGVEGGRPLPFTHSFPQALVDKLLPMDLNAKRRLRAFNLENRKLRMASKRPVILLGGLSGLEAAQAFRGKPGTPGGLQGAGRQEPALPSRLRGRRREHDLAPTPIVRRLASEAARFGSRI